MIELLKVSSNQSKAALTHRGCCKAKTSPGPKTASEELIASATKFEEAFTPDAEYELDQLRASTHICSLERGAGEDLIYPLQAFSMES